MADTPTDRGINDEACFALAKSILEQTEGGWEPSIAQSYRILQAVLVVLDYEALLAERDALKAALLQGRSDAIREFCTAAGILGSVEAKHLPEDVRAYRMASAINRRNQQGDRP